MFRSFKEPWFIVYAFILIFAILAQEAVSPLLVCLGGIVVILVHLEVWPRSKCWIHSSRYFKRYNVVGCGSVLLCSSIAMNLDLVASVELFPLGLIPIFFVMENSIFDK